MDSQSDDTEVVAIWQVTCMNENECKFEVYANGIPFPEGPVFDSHGNLFVCARRDGYIVKVTPDRVVHRFVDTRGKPNGLAIDSGDCLYVADAVRKEILIVEPDGTIDVLVPAEFGERSLVGPNDLCFGHSGALYFTDPGLSMDIHDGVVYHLNPDRTELKCLAQGLPFPNGLAVTPDESTFYFVESVLARMYAVDLAGNLTASPRLVCEFSNGVLPDGIEWLDERHLIAAGHTGGAMIVVNIVDAAQQRISLHSDSKPTNVVIHQGHLYVTDDTTQSVLTAPLDIYSE